MVRKFLLLFFVFLLVFPVSAFAVSYYDSNNQNIFWADSTYKDDFMKSLRVDGLGKVTVKFTPFGEKGHTVKLDLDRSSTFVDVPPTATGFTFESPECYAFAVSATTTNPNSSSLSFQKPPEAVQPVCYKKPTPTPTPDPNPEDGGKQPDPVGETIPVCGACCDKIAGILSQMNASAFNSGLQLGSFYNMVDSHLGDTVRELSGLNKSLDGVNDRLDRANDTLDGVLEQVTPTGDYDIPSVDWDDEASKHSAPYVDKIKRIDDNQTYFKDPGQVDESPRMPKQPGIFYPVPIGDSMDREGLIGVEAPLSKENPLKRGSSGIADTVPVRDSAPTQQDSQTREPVLNKDSVYQKDNMSRDPVLPKDNMSRDPVLSKDKMSRDPVLSKGRYNKDPVLTRTPSYKKQEVLKKP